MLDVEDIMRALVLFCFLVLPGLAQADEPAITVKVANDTHTLHARRAFAAAGRCHYRGSA